VSDEVTVGEVYRRLVDMDDKLDRIETQVRTTNGRTTKLEALVDELRGSVRRLWAKRSDVPHTPPSSPPVEAGESISVKISPAMWRALAAAGGALAALLWPKLTAWMATWGGV